MMVRATALMALLAAAGAVQAAAAESAKPVGFQSYQIGISLDAARALPIAPDPRWGRIWMKCTDEPDAPASLRRSLSATETELSVVKCWPVQSIGGSMVRAGIDLGSDIEATIEFSFAGGKLYRIETFYDFVHRATMSDALSARYGKATTTEIDAVGNRFGANVPRETKIWELSSGRIVYEAPALNLERMAVTYSDPAIADGIAKKSREDEAASLKI
jgi:hypothetical protein